MKKITILSLLTTVFLLAVATACGTSEADDQPAKIEGPAFVLFYTDN
jgi:integral membrane sensor domain MASE1